MPPTYHTVQYSEFLHCHTARMALESIRFTDLLKNKQNINDKKSITALISFLRLRPCR